MDKECIFCKIVSGKIPCEKIYENENFFSIPDANPIAKGHSLVISKKHFANILELPASFGQELLDCIKKTSEQIFRDTKATGINIVNNNFPSAGQVINHVHFHIIPRSEGDGVKLYSKKD